MNRCDWRGKNPALALIFCLPCLLVSEFALAQSAPSGIYHPDRNLAHRYDMVCAVRVGNRAALGYGFFQCLVETPQSSETGKRGDPLLAADDGVGLWLNNTDLLAVNDLTRYSSDFTVTLPDGRQVPAERVELKYPRPFSVLRIAEPCPDARPVQFARKWAAPSEARRFSVVRLTPEGDPQILAMPERINQQSMVTGSKKTHINHYHVVGAKLDLSGSGKGAVLLTPEGHVQGMVARFVYNTVHENLYWTALYGYDLHATLLENKIPLNAVDDDWPDNPEDVATRVAASMARIQVRRTEADTARRRVYYSGVCNQSRGGDALLVSMLTPWQNGNRAILDGNGVCEMDAPEKPGRIPNSIIPERAQPKPVGWAPEDEDQLPFLLGPMRRFFFEPSPPDRNSREYENDLEIQIVNENSGFRAAIRRDPKYTVLLTLDARMARQCQLADDGSLTCEINFKSLDHPRRPRFHMTGTKTIQMNEEIGMPDSVRFDGNYVQHLGKHSMEAEVSIILRRLDDGQTPSYAGLFDADDPRQKGLDRRTENAEKHRLQREQKKKDESVDVEEVKAVVKSRKPDETRRAMMTLALMKEVEPDAEFANFLLENRFDSRLSSMLYSVAAKFATAENIALMQKVVADETVKKFDQTKIQRALDRLTAVPIGEVTDLDVLVEKIEKREIPINKFRELGAAGEDVGLRLIESEYPQIVTRGMAALMECGTERSLDRLRKFAELEADDPKRMWARAVYQMIRWRTR